MDYLFKKDGEDFVLQVHTNSGRNEIAEPWADESSCFESHNSRSFLPLTNQNESRQIPPIAHHHLCSSLTPLPGIKGQAIGLRLESDDRALGKVKHVPGDRVDLLPGLVGDVEFALHDDLHLVVRVRVDQRSACLESVEATGNGLRRLKLVTG